MNRRYSTYRIRTSAGRSLLAALALVSASGVAAPRIAPLAPAQWNAEQQQIAELQPAPLTNAFMTFLHNPALARDIMPFQHYIERHSTLPARDRLLLALRTAWLSRSNYVWARHAAAADQGTLSAAELSRIAAGPDDTAWSAVDAALLRAADELHVDSFISDATWAVLDGRYATEQLLDIVFTVGEFTMLAGAVNSLKTGIEETLTARLPYGVPYAPAARWTNDRLIGQAPRIPPLERSDWSDEARALLDPDDTGRAIANVYRTYAHHPTMDSLRRGVSEHIRDATTLTDRQREILLIRIGILCRSEYEWSAHVRIGRGIGLDDAAIERLLTGPAHPDNDPLERALLRAVDELYRDDFVTDETWAMLEEHLDTRQLLDMLIAVGGYRMLSMAMNTLGVQLDANAERFPAYLR
jgi:alkylhydroperoxidase family enzyme